MSDFQTQVGAAPAPGVAGDFADTNPRASLNAGPGALVAGNDGLTVGLFAWVTNDSSGQPESVENNGSGVPDGFVHREMQGLITTYLAGAAMTIPAGFGVTLMTEGGFWAKNEGAGAAAVGGAVYTDPTNGKIRTTSGGGRVATNFKFASAGAVDELVKITSHYMA